MRKLWIGLSVSISILLSGCTSNYFKLPVQENPEALKRFDKPIQYYNFYNVVYTVILVADGKLNI